MAAKLAELRKQAKEMGIAPALIRACDTPEELQSVISGFGGGNDSDAPAKPRKKAHGKVQAKGKKGKNSTSASSKSAPAAKKSGNSGKAKRPTAAKKQTGGGTDGPSGRNLLNGVDFSETDGWNPRPGSPPDRIVKALKRAKGNRAKVFDALVDEIWEFVGKKKADGTKRSKADAEAMLRYRISRTAFDFAVRTGQHEASDNRATYGTGGTGQGIFKRKGKGNSAKASKPASKPASTKAKAGKRTTAKAGKGSTSKSASKAKAGAKGGKKKAGKK